LDKIRVHSVFVSIIFYGLELELELELGDSGRGGGGILMSSSSPGGFPRNLMGIRIFVSSANGWIKEYCCCIEADAEPEPEPPKTD
jgi:hypothetical protein